MKKGLLLDDIVAQMHYIDIKVERAFFHPELTEPEVNYISKSGKNKFKWVKQDEVNNSN